MNPAAVIRLAAVFGFFGVALGAFGAHALKAQLTAFGTTAIWQTAVLYHLIHAVVLLALGLQARARRLLVVLFVAGIVIFSGSLYLLAYTDVKWLGAITPIGGLSFLAGWAILAWKPA